MTERKTMMLPVKLNEIESRERGAEMSTKVIELVELKAVHAQRKKAMSEEEKERDAEVCRLARIVRSGYENRPVEVQAVPSLGRNMMDYVRLDTGETVESRPMTRAEIEEAMQVPLFKDAADARNN